jgi:hypothetical protein
MGRFQLPPRRDGVLILAMVGVFIAGLTAGGLLFTFGNDANGVRRWQKVAFGEFLCVLMGSLIALYSGVSNPALMRLLDALS